MYSAIKQIQIIVSLLKQYDIRNVVISPGTRHVPLVHCLEIDPFFTTYSIVDERSAAYFALGLSESLNEPVAVTCTSATATCNYLPAIQEAFERGIQLLALTSDRARYQRFNGENQCINQVDMYKPFVRYSVDLPNVKNDEEYWYCNRCVNEALIELNHHGKGPVQINFLQPLTLEELSSFTVKEISETRKIKLHQTDVNWDDVKVYLSQKKRILVASGQNTVNEELNRTLNEFSNNRNVVVTKDHFSNLSGEHFIHAPYLSVILNSEEIISFKPDLIISYGTKVFSEIIVRYRNCGIEHWHIDPEGRINDITRTLSAVYEMKPSEFFSKANPSLIGDNAYLKMWRDRLEDIDFSENVFTNNSVIRDVLQKLPENSVVHASVLNSMRLSNFYSLPKNTSYVGNIGCDGIDGALSTFLGQASCHKKISLLIVGDLSFLYDLNGAINKIPNNVRILLINNYAGAEFHYNISLNKISTLNQNIAAGHHTSIKEIIKLTNLEYWSADNNGTLEKLSLAFFEKSDFPILLEVFTDANTDGECLRNFFSKNIKLTKRNRVGNIIRLVLGNKIAEVLRKL
ncbi:2-succinyl-5-enolpyruvyl-6-hydroxy-3-cyclohexene-1-carboxylic-acid synthase [Bacteroides bouchesdurhonensis]|uniref:2-succinyl-5-enolpyruvyl-6-hydroxy-3- cyclohexene-1-carboxylic-acid synthase n=1 Tax=Bacteroides bouchesdurhonensis TaxID=1841855 RepID=UPI0021CB29FD|nr:2-succinyl-5-enolpyruvyl-6-hydroxy-3-cyclohexene-1-carboxylic-acid synthase [Bacteroides bouchesdurhonensis]